MRYKKLLSTINQRGISKNKLALMAGITPSGLYAALSGKSNFWPGWRQRVADALGMDEEELFGADGEKGTDDGKE